MSKAKSYRKKPKPAKKLSRRREVISILGLDYNEQKLNAMMCWGSRCCYCGGVLGEDTDAHHGIIPRNRGMRIDFWWNLFPTHHGDCHEKGLHTRNGFELVMQKYYRVLSPADPELGREFLVKAVAMLVESGHLKIAPVIPPVEYEGDDA